MSKNSDYCRTDNIGQGQKVVADFGRDNSSHDLPDTMGGKMGGSITNLDATIKGATATQKVGK